MNFVFAVCFLICLGLMCHFTWIDLCYFLFVLNQHNPFMINAIH